MPVLVSLLIFLNWSFQHLLSFLKTVSQFHWLSVKMFSTYSSFKSSFLYIVTRIGQSWFQTWVLAVPYKNRNFNRGSIIIWLARWMPGSTTHLPFYIYTILVGQSCMRNQYAKALLSSVASDRKIYQPPMHNSALSIITLHPFSITPQGHPVLPVCELPPPL